MKYPGYIGLALLLGSPFLSSIGNAQVIESNTMVPVFSDTSSKTLIVLDLDNTTFEADQTFGSNQWLDAEAKKLITAGMEPREAFERMSALWEKAQAESRVKPVSEETPYLIRHAQEQGQYVIALTVRRPEIAEETLNQLKKINISFEAHPIHQGAVDISVSDHMAHTARFENGVIFGGPTNNKGQILLEFLKKIGMEGQFTKIVFADDKAKNVDEFSKALIGSPYEVHAYRYGGADEKVKKYDHELALFQYHFWVNRGVLLLDSEARALMQNPACEYLLTPTTPAKP